jgi:hypothetical protein
MLLNSGVEAPTGNWPMVVALVLLDALEAADVLELLLLSGCAPLRWPWGWKLTVGSAFVAAEEMALKVIGIPSSLKVCRRSGAAAICRRCPAVCGHDLPLWR